MSNFKIGDIAGFNVGDKVVYESGFDQLFEVIRHPKSKKLLIRILAKDNCRFGRYGMKPLSKLRFATEEEVEVRKRL